ncbi:MAG: serine/threonine-protein kinase [Thermoanaerobaculia bacterium]|jgi:serine/threonine protein kinase
MPRNDDPTRRLGPNDTQEIIERAIVLSDPLDPLIGELIGGRYQLLAMVGRGGFGRVYRARDLKLDRMIAVKLMTEPGGSTDHEARLRVLRETRANARLQHPHIVTLHDAGEDPRGLYLVLEYVAGTSLDAVLAGGPLPAERAAEILRECAGALAAAHAQGIIHRDIKPANILITENGSVKIADFGIARLLGESHTTDRGSIVGTPNYMAPEQIDGRGVGPAADIFELGCVAYEMISGRPPFHGGTPSEVIGRILKGLPDPLPPLAASTAPLVDLITQMLKKSAADRPLPSAIIEAIDSWRAGQGESRPRIRRRITIDWRVALAALAFALLIGGIIAVRYLRRADTEGAASPPPSPTVVQRASVERSAPPSIVRKSVTFSNRDNVFRFLDFLGHDRQQVTRLDDLTLRLDGPAEEVDKRIEEARIIDSMPGQRFDFGHNLLRDGLASDQAVSVALARISADELVELFAWSTGWPVVQRHDFLDLAARLGPLRVEARAQSWDLIVAKVLDVAGAEAIRIESSWLIVPKGAGVREPLRVLAIYEGSRPDRRLEETITAFAAQGAVMLKDEVSTPRGLIVVAPSRVIVALRSRLATKEHDGLRLVEPPVFSGKPMSLRVRDASCAELVALAGGASANPSGERIAATVSDVPSDEMLAVALASGDEGARLQGEEPFVDLVASTTSRPPSFYAPLATLAGERGALVADEGAKAVKLHGNATDAESLRRAIVAIDAMLASR